MPVARKFTFDRTFESPLQRGLVTEEIVDIAPEIPLEVPAAPMFSEEELAAARDEAYAQGREAGIKEMSESLEREIRDTLIAVENALRELMWSQAAVETRSSEDAVKVALAAVRRLFPMLAEREPLAEIENLVGQAMNLVQGEAILNIHVNDRLVDPVAARIQPMAVAADFQDRIKIHPLASIAPGDCRIEWGNGGIVRDAAAIAKMIEDLIARSLPAPAPEAGETGPSAPTAPAAETSAPENSEGHHG